MITFWIIVIGIDFACAFLFGKGDFTVAIICLLVMFWALAQISREIENQRSYNNN